MGLEIHKLHVLFVLMASRLQLLWFAAFAYFLVRCEGGVYDYY